MCPEPLRSRSRRSLRSLRPVAPATFVAVVTIAVFTGGFWALLAAPRLLEVTPPPAEVGAEGVSVLVQFDADGRAAAPTFRATLNGADVTDRLFVASNGVEGRLHELLDGDNVLVLSVFGEGIWPRSVWIEERREFRIRYRSPIGWNQG